MQADKVNESTAEAVAANGPASYLEPDFDLIQEDLAQCETDGYLPTSEEAGYDNTMAPALSVPDDYDNVVMPTNQSNAATLVSHGEVATANAYDNVTAVETSDDVPTTDYDDPLPPAPEIPADYDNITPLQGHLADTGSNEANPANVHENFASVPADASILPPKGDNVDWVAAAQQSSPGTVGTCQTEDEPNKEADMPCHTSQHAASLITKPTESGDYLSLPSNSPQNVEEDFQYDMLQGTSAQTSKALTNEDGYVNANAAFSGGYKETGVSDPAMSGRSVPMAGTRNDQTLLTDPNVLVISNSSAVSPLSESELGATMVETSNTMLQEQSQSPSSQHKPVLRL